MRVLVYGRPSVGLVQSSLFALVFCMGAVVLPAIAQESEPSQPSQKPASTGNSEAARGSKSDAGESGKETSSSKTKSTPKQAEKNSDANEVGVANIYDKWSQETLKQEGSENGEVHPLAKQHPDQYVVICEAGCDQMDGRIVGMKPRVDEDKDGQNASAADTSQITCIGGCFDGEGNFSGLSDDYNGAGEWMDAPEDDASASKPARVKKRWYDRIN